ncbi:6-bladed beta-propeller [Parabacteroides sp. PF5-9]|uniref:6-bladed beta-propeller n=1 Tax=Parabacteroides sp. PF5-9 TaxID=1742404 RepID=UPI002475CCDD|nr:6-bladed beta-propeller [Parabacteroides sp. PF5-9]MDH6359007.1 hypothetical protein [Parabacteroides sp. PF5-9]
MKIRSLFLSLFLGSLLSGCINTLDDSQVIALDVAKLYTERDIRLEEIADITYLQLDDRDEKFLFRGNIGAISSTYLIGSDPRSGDILFFTRDGKPKHKFNRKGGGPEEYSQLFTFIYDEEKDELFVHERNKIRVYNSSGEYKRVFSLPPESFVMNDYALLDDRSIVLFDMNLKSKANMRHMRLHEDIEERQEVINEHESSFIRLSVLDGHVEEYIKVPEDFFGVDLTVLDESSGSPRKIVGRTYHLIRHQEGLLLHNHETDTVYLYKRDHTLVPYMVQTPSVKSLNPGIYINTVVDRGNYQFIELQTLRVKLPGPLLTTHLVRDKKSGAVFTPVITMKDFKGKEMTINRNTVQCIQNANEGLLTFTVDELREAYDAGRLSGELKSFVEQMEEENENDVLVMLRFK